MAGQGIDNKGSKSGTEWGEQSDKSYYCKFWARCQRWRRGGSWVYTEGGLVVFGEGLDTGGRRRGPKDACQAFELNS
jgi:hypothetical protein